MCGFVVIAALAGQRIGRDALTKCSTAIEHRGPDDEKIILKDNIGIVFRRLSINDLANGAQPLWAADNSRALVCNGEIYNSPDLRQRLEAKGEQFHTNSDCEVILPLYRNETSNFVNNLEGMFALVITDFASRRLIFARDRFGIKPLYYFIDKSWLIIGSEIKALLASGYIPAECNARNIYDSFTFGFPIDQQTFVKGIFSLPPASIADFDLTLANSLKIRQYWKPTFHSCNEARDLLAGPKVQKEVRNSLSQAVKSHLLSDVPVAAYLSGGMDSTITSLLMKQNLDSTINTFSIKFSDADFDESEQFLKTNALAKFSGNIVEASSTDITLFPEAIRSIEMLQTTPMDIPLIKLSERVRASGIKVVLSGEGADELFGGYSVFPWIHIAQTLSLSTVSAFQEPLSEAALNFMGIHPLARASFKFVFSDECKEIENNLGFFPPWIPFWHRKLQRCPSLFAEPEKFSIKDNLALLELGATIQRDYPGLNRFDAGLLAEIKTRLPNYILHRADRTSMKNSVEVRVPFLDRQCAETALRCPALLKTLGFREKSVLSKAFKDILPPHLKGRRKYGYSAPNEWCWTPEAKHLREQYLSTEALNRSGIFNVKEVESRMRAVQTSIRENKRTLESIEDLSFLTGIISFQILNEEFFAR